MHIAGGSVFLLQGRRQIFQGGTGQGAKSFGYGRATVKLGAFSGWGGAGHGGAFLKIFGPGRSGAANFPRAGVGRGGACIPGRQNCLLAFILPIVVASYCFTLLHSL